MKCAACHDVSSTHLYVNDPLDLDAQLVQNSSYSSCTIKADLFNLWVLKDDLHQAGRLIWTERSVQNLTHLLLTQHEDVAMWVVTDLQAGTQAVAALHRHVSVCCWQEMTLFFMKRI